MTREQRFCSEAQSRRYARPKVFDQNVGVSCESQRLRRAARTLQVEHDAAFASLQNCIRWMTPKRSDGRINPDHVGTLISEHHGDQWACQVLTAIQHFDSFKCSHGGTFYQTESFPKG